jgi:hypothetical protein
MMTPESDEIVVPAKSKHGKLIANAGSPSGWRDSWLRYECVALRYNTGAECGFHCY